MAEADCGLCDAMGYRTCDICEGIVFVRPPEDKLDLCYDCRVAAAGNGATMREAGSL